MPNVAGIMGAWVSLQWVNVPTTPNHRRLASKSEKRLLLSGEKAERRASQPCAPVRATASEHRSTSLGILGAVCFALGSALRLLPLKPLHYPLTGVFLTRAA